MNRAFNTTPSSEQREAVRAAPRDRSPVMFQRWENLLFLHWPVNPEIIQDTLPDGLRADTYAGKAYLGIVPFSMKGIRPRFCPTVPGLSGFPELNLRTYVYDKEGRPGVWFYSLDAHQAIAVWIARTVFSLPYYRADMSVSQNGNNSVKFRSQRKGTPEQVFRYQAADELPSSQIGSLEFFLTERYLLFSFSKKKGQLYVGRVHHNPYPLFKAVCPEFSTELFRLNGFSEPSGNPASALFSPGVDVSIFSLQKATR